MKAMERRLQQKSFWYSSAVMLGLEMSFDAVVEPSIVELLVLAA